MLRSAKKVVGCRVKARNGYIGNIEDFYFDDRQWGIRYAVVDTGGWMLGKRVLISPVTFGDRCELERKVFPINLTKKQITEAPDINADLPFSRQKEEELTGYYNWPAYWDVTLSAHPVQPVLEKGAATQVAEPPRDSHLRSVHAVNGYHIQAVDGGIGHVEDFLIDDEQWVIRYLVVDTRNFWPGKSVLVAVNWIGRIEWAESRVYIELEKEKIRNSPLYDASAVLNRDYEEKMHDYYDRPGYWSS